MQSRFRIELTSDTSVPVLTLHGELDLASSGDLEQELERLLADHNERMIVDLRKLEFMDSTGLSVLIRAHQRAEESGARLSLVKGPPQVQRLLRLTGLADRIDLLGSPEELRS